MIRRRIDSEIRIWDATCVNNYFMRSPNDKRLEIEQIEPCGNLFIVEVFDKEPNSHDCPLIELPDHGDLIDRDVVVARLADWSKRLIKTYGENDEYVKCLSVVLEGLGCDDVIVPAERKSWSGTNNES